MTFFSKKGWMDLSGAFVTSGIWNLEDMTARNVMGMMRLKQWDSRS